MIYTGSIKNAFLLTVTDAPVFQFVYGTIKYDLSKRFSPGDWIATSNIIKFKKVDNGHAAITQNSIYLVECGFEKLDITWDTVDNIRLGTHPDVALKLLKGTFGTK